MVLEKLKLAAVWFKDHAWIIVLVLLGVFGLGALGLQKKMAGSGGLVGATKAQLAVVGAGHKAAKVAIEQGHETAVKAIESQNATVIASFDASQNAKLEELKSSPRAMASWITAVSRKPPSTGG